MSHTNTPFLIPPFFAAKISPNFPLNFISRPCTRPEQIPPVHYKYYEEELQANLKSEVNPFPLHSEWVDRDIKVGDIDEEVRKTSFFLSFFLSSLLSSFPLSFFLFFFLSFFLSSFLSLVVFVFDRGRPLALRVRCGWVGYGCGDDDAEPGFPKPNIYRQVQGVTRIVGLEPHPQCSLIPDSGKRSLIRRILYSRT